MSIPVTRYFSGEFLPQRQLTHVSCPFAFHVVLGKTGLIEIGTDQTLLLEPHCEPKPLNIPFFSFLN